MHFGDWMHQPLPPPSFPLFPLSLTQKVHCIQTFNLYIACLGQCSFNAATYSIHTCPLSATLVYDRIFQRLADVIFVAFVYPLPLFSVNFCVCGCQKLIDCFILKHSYLLGVFIFARPRKTHDKSPVQFAPYAKHAPHRILDLFGESTSPHTTMTHCYYH